MKNFFFWLGLFSVLLVAVLPAADVDDRTIPAWTNYLNNKTSFNGPHGSGWKRGRGDQALLEEDLRRQYLQEVSSGNLGAQEEILANLMAVNPSNPEYLSWGKKLESERNLQTPAEVRVGLAQPFDVVHVDPMGRLGLPGPEFMYEWNLVMPASVQAGVLEQLDQWRRQKKSEWAKVQIRAGSATSGGEGDRQLTVYPLTLWQANELTTFVRNQCEKAGLAKSAITAPDLVMIPASTPVLAKGEKGSLERMVKQGQGSGRPGTAGEPTYSFTAKNAPVADALALFAKLNQLNILPDPDVGGEITVDFRGLTLDKAMEAILESLGAYAEGEGGLIRVRGMETRIFTLDYLRLKRSGKTTMETELSSGNNTTAGSGGGGGGSGSAGKVSIDSEDTVDVWKDMEAQIKTLLSDKGKVSVNSLAGTIVVTDRKRNLEGVNNYITILDSRLNRQVDLDVRVLEATFTDDRLFAVDWNQVAKTVGNTTLTAAAVLSPGGIPSTLFPALAGGTIPNLIISNNSITTIIKAIEDQTKVRIASQPRVRTLNHQTSIIKVVRQDPFFTSQSNVLQSQSGNSQGNNVQVNSVETGTVLSITPQISDDEKITLEILPSVTVLAGTESFVQQVPQTNNTTITTTNATAPRLRSRQASTVVRVNDMETVVMGGFIEDQVFQTRKKVPILGDIPLLGTLFTGMADGKIRLELIFLVSPGIVRERTMVKN